MLTTMEDIPCPMCGRKNLTHELDCKMGPYIEFAVNSMMSNVERIRPKRVEFDLEEGSATIVLLQHEGEDVLEAIGGGHYLAFGEPVTPGQVASVLRTYLDERFKG